MDPQARDQGYEQVAEWWDAGLSPRQEVGYMQRDIFQTLES